MNKELALRIAEYATIKRIITKDVPMGIISVVCDSFDYWNVLTDVLPKLKDDILARPTNELGMSKVVIRPDSGDPVEIICGYEFKTISATDFESFKRSAERLIVNTVQNETPHGEAGDWDVTQIFKFSGDGKYYSVNVTIEWNRYDKQYYYVDGSSLISVEEIQLTAEQKGSIEVLWDLFGGTVNDKGYKVLDSHIGLIYGDSITMTRADEIYRRLEQKGFSADNIVLGVGSYTYQMVSRDTLGYAMKATNIIKNSESIPLFKDPKTDNGTKKSAKGLLKVIKNNGKLQLIDNVSREDESLGELTTLFLDGQFMKHQSFDEIRKLVKENV